eukprot:1159752-Pelagomonas_calceolata.AAC.3
MMQAFKAIWMRALGLYAFLCSCTQGKLEVTTEKGTGESRAANNFLKPPIPIRMQAYLVAFFTPVRRANWR